MQSDILRDLMQGNSDVPRVDEYLAGLHAETRLDEHLLPALNSGAVRSVLLIAHAGDGKSHFLRRLGGTVRWINDKRGLEDAPGLYVLNDPSQTDPEPVCAFLHAAFSGDAPRDHRFVAAINRGLLRDLLPQIDDKATREWLQRAQRMVAGVHAPDERGRVAVPLDLRTLVPGPGSEQVSPAETLARRVLEREGAPDAQAWAHRIAVALALVEATGAHVTFREIVCLTADVAIALHTGDPGKALARLFQAETSPPPLIRIFRALRRFDPARVATPKDDSEHSAAEARDEAVRIRAWEALGDLFVGTGYGEDARLPLARGVPFLRLCASLGADLEKRLSTLRSVAELASGHDLEPDLKTHLEAALETRWLRKPVADLRDDVRKSAEKMLAGLSYVAWGPEATEQTRGVLPLTTRVHPGRASAVTRWRILRGALGLEHAAFATPVVDPGPYVERHLVLPHLLVAGPGTGDGPPLLLDLDLFDRLCRVGLRGGSLADLGSRAAQVQTWLDALVEAWEPALVDGPRGFIVFQTLLGADHRAPVPLRPARPGPSVAPVVEGAEEPRSTLDMLKACWAETATSGKRSVALTPSACASALLRWAGFAAETPAEGVVEQHPMLRAALGAASVERVHRRTKFISPAFPWSLYALDLGVQQDGGALKVEAYEEGAAVGATCARALGLKTGAGWRGRLRHAWAADEETFDAHPSALLAHQWLGLAIGGRQVASVEAPPVELLDLRTQVLFALTEANPPFARTERWWLIGVWAAWWLFIDGLRELHGVDLPLLLPRVGGDGSAHAARTHAQWFEGVPDNHARVALVALGQAAGFLQPPSLPRRFAFELAESTLDLLRLCAWSVARRYPEPTDRTIARLQDALLEAGIFLRPGGMPVRDRLPKGALVAETVEATSFDDALRLTLRELGLLDTASDGATLFRAPWEDSGR